MKRTKLRRRAPSQEEKEKSAFSLPDQPRATRVLRLVTAVLLVAVAGIAGGVSWRFMRDSELDKFQLRWDDITNKIASQIESGLKSRAKAAQAVAEAFPLPPAGSGLNLLNPRFQAFGKTITESVDATSATISVIVYPEDRESFERNVAANYSTLLLPSSNVTRQFLSAKHTNGIRDPRIFLFDNFSYAYGSYPRALEGNLRPLPDGSRPFFTANLQSAPVEVGLIVNEAYYYERAYAHFKVLQTGTTQATGLTMANAEVLRIKRLRVATLLVAPIFWVDPVTNATSITGFSQLSLSWSQALAGAVQASCQMDVLLTSYGNQNIDSERIFIPGSTYPNVAEFTIRLDEKGAHDLGWGDRRETARALRSYARTVRLSVGDVPFALEVTPTQDCLEAFFTDTPGYTLMGAILITAVVAATGVVYDVLARSYLAAVVRGYLETTPLNAVAGAAALLADTPLNDEQRELLQILSGGASNVVVIIDDILSLNALETGKFRVHWSRVDLKKQVIESAWKMLLMQPSLQERLGSLSLSYHVAPGVPAFVVTDATRALQIVNNLLNNSAKFCGDGGSITFEVDTVSVARSASSAAAFGGGGGGGGEGGGGGADSSSSGKGEQAGAAAAIGVIVEDGESAAVSADTERFLRFRVTDTGIGIAPAALAFIFLPFTQADSASNREFQGTGLGLAIGRMIAEALGGSLECTSEGLGKGACFTFLLPLSPPATAEVDGIDALSDAERARRAELPFSMEEAREAAGVPAAASPSGGVGVQSALALGVGGGGGNVPRRDARRRRSADDLTPSPAPAALSAARSGPAALPFDARKKVLVAEDDKVNRFLIRKILEKRGLAVTLAEGGEECVRLFEQAQAQAEGGGGGGVFDIVVTDLNMPVCDGHEAAVRIRALEAERRLPRTPIVAVSASCSDEEVRRCRESGMDGHLSKPLVTDSLGLLDKLIDEAAAANAAGASSRDAVVAVGSSSGLAQGDAAL